MEFPKYYKCVCGSDKRVSEIATKAIYPDCNVPTAMGHDEPVMIANGMNIPVIPKGVLAYWDICFDCGRRYYHRVEIVQARISLDRTQQLIVKGNN